LNDRAIGRSGDWTIGVVASMREHPDLSNVPEVAQQQL
jgi:hypothetical protein